jgi:hypothetical protein
MGRQTHRPVVRAWVAVVMLMAVVCGAHGLAWALDCEGRLVSEGQAPWEVQAITATVSTAPSFDSIFSMARLLSPAKTSTSIYGQWSPMIANRQAENQGISCHRGGAALHC